MTADGKKISLSRPALATNPWMDMLINGFVSFADPGNLTRRIFVPNPPQDVKGYLQDGTEFDLNQIVTITQNWTEQFSLTPGWNSRAATNLALNPITVAASLALPSVSVSGTNTFRLNNPQPPYVTNPTYRALAENFRNNTLIDPLHAGTTTTSTIPVTFSTAVPGATLNVPTESVTLTSTLPAWTDNPLATSASNVSTGTLDRNTASEISTVASLAVGKPCKNNGNQRSPAKPTGTQSGPPAVDHDRNGGGRLADCRRRCGLRGCAVVPFQHAAGSGVLDANPGERFPSDGNASAVQLSSSLARPAKIPREREAETGRKANPDQ